jgi:hypothetical protein
MPNGKKDETLTIGKNEAIGYAMSLAIHEAVSRGQLTSDQGEAVYVRIIELYDALMDGKFLERLPNGLYKIHDDALVVEDDEE